MLTLTCFGDSLVYGFPYEPEYSWTAVLGEKLGVDIINEGFCGAATGDILDKMRYTPLPPTAKHVLFFGGANDVLQHCPQSVTLENIRRVQKLAAEKGWLLCIVLPLLSGERAAGEKILALREKISQLQGAFLLDLQPAVGNSSEKLQEAYLDGWHPKAQVYRQMGEYAATLLKDWLGNERAEKQTLCL